MTELVDLYCDFYIPLSELRQIWQQARFMAKHGDTSSPRVSLLDYIDDRKLAHVERKLLEMMDDWVEAEAKVETDAHHRLPPRCG